VRCFKENPESFTRKCNKASTEWTEEVFIQALNDCELVPQADPNTASHSMRLMKVMALKQLQAANPSMYDSKAIDLAALKAIGWNNPNQFMAPPEQQNQMPPQMMQAIEELKIKKQEADAKTLTARANAQKAMQGDSQQPAPLDQNKVLDMHLKEQDLRQKQMDAQIKQMDIEATMKEALIAAQTEQASTEARMKEALLKNQDDRFEAANRQRDRESAERIASVKLATDLAKNPEASEAIDKIITKDMMDRLRSNEPPIEGE
jgi:Fe2+ transport system protein B